MENGYAGKGPLRESYLRNRSAWNCHLLSTTLKGGSWDLGQECHCQAMIGRRRWTHRHLGVEHVDTELTSRPETSFNWRFLV
jgi:hypothetical protein